jgi:PEP-CTERM motif
LDQSARISALEFDMTTFQKMILRAWFFAMLSSVAGSAGAAITYKFNAISSNGGPYGSFEVTTPNFVTGIVEFSEHDVTNCTVVFPTGNQVCGNQYFNTETFGSPEFYEILVFGAAIVGVPGNSETLYFFEQGSFATVGVHSSLLFGPEQFATLSVSDSSIVAGVPEPATWAMMIAGFGLVGAGMRRRAARTAACAS